MSHRRILACTCLLLCGSGPALAGPPEVRIAFGLSLEPYVFADSATGLEVDVVRAALRQAGYALKPLFYPQARLPVVYMTGRDIQGVALMTDKSGIRAAYSHPYISYEDVAITLADARPLQSIQDMADLRVLAFPLASTYLGAEFARMAHANPLYSETPNQYNQNRLLYRKAIDVVVADSRIFAYFNRKLVADNLEQPQDTRIHHLFQRIPYQIAFHDPHLRDAFDKGLARIEQNGIYRQIMLQYP